MSGERMRPPHRHSFRSNTRWESLTGNGQRTRRDELCRPLGVVRDDATTRGFACDITAAAKAGTQDRDGLALDLDARRVAVPHFAALPDVRQRRRRERWRRRQCCQQYRLDRTDQLSKDICAWYHTASFTPEQSAGLILYQRSLPFRSDGDLDLGGILPLDFYRDAGSATA
jgi:hypothetical protein